MIPFTAPAPLAFLCRRRLRRGLGAPLRHAAAVALALLALLTSALPLDAHTRLTASAPAAGAALHSAPRDLWLRFSEPPQVAFTSVRLLDASGAEQSLTPLQGDTADPLAVRAAIRGALGPGRYVVEWQTASRDGHPIRGRFDFEVIAHADSAGAIASTTARVPSAGAAADSAAGHSAADIHQLHERMGAAEPHSRGETRLEYRVARWAEFVALLALIGAVVFRLAVLPRLSGGPAMRIDGADAARQIALGALVLLLGAWLARLGSELSALTGGMTDELPLGALTQTPWGRGWLGGLAALPVTALGLLAARGWRGGWLLAALGTVALAATPALTGHAAATRDFPVAAILTDTVHVLAGGAWLGTLLLVVIAGIPTILRAQRVAGAGADDDDDADPMRAAPTIAGLLRALHPVALLGAATVVGTGIASSWLRLRTPEALLGSDYGRWLLIKVAFVLVVLALGAFHWRGVRRAGERRVDDQQRAAHAFRRTAVVELLVGLMVLAVTATLVVTSPR